MVDLPQIILIFYLILHNCRHLAAQEYYDDPDLAEDSEDDQTVYYHVKEATWVTKNVPSTKKRQPRYQNKLSSTIKSSTTSSETTTTISQELKSTMGSRTSRHSKATTSRRTTQFINVSTILTEIEKTRLSTTSAFMDPTWLPLINLSNSRKDMSSVKTAQKDYTNASVLLITPASIEQMNEILEFEYIGEEYHFWSHRRVIDAPLTVLLPAEDTLLRRILRERKIDYTMLIENLQTVFEMEREKVLRQMPPSLTGISFNMYLRYEFVMGYLKHLSLKYPERARVIKIGKTLEDRDIVVLEVKDASRSDKNVGAIFVEAGMHGREWLGVSTALYLINQLVEHAAANKDMFDGVFWYILPILNADGYEYSHSTDRLWKNNRKKYENCTGVDLDRNFRIENIKSKDLTKYKCTNLYPGHKPNSEPETKALERFIEKTRTLLKVYLSLHSGDPFIAYPWAHKSERTSDYEQIVDLATIIKHAIEEGDNSTSYKVDGLYSLCGSYDGAAIDWAKQQGVLYPLMVSLKGGGAEGFDIPSEYIFETVVAAHGSMRAIAHHLRIQNKVAIVIEGRNQLVGDDSSTIRSFMLDILLLLIMTCLI